MHEHHDRQQRVERELHGVRGDAEDGGGEPAEDEDGDEDRGGVDEGDGEADALGDAHGLGLGPAGALLDEGGLERVEEGPVVDGAGQGDSRGGADLADDPALFGMYYSNIIISKRRCNNLKKVLWYYLVGFG